MAQIREKWFLALDREMLTINQIVTSPHLMNIIVILKNRNLLNTSSQEEQDVRKSEKCMVQVYYGYMSLLRLVTLSSIDAAFL